MKSILVLSLFAILTAVPQLRRDGASEEFRLPGIPAGLTDPEERAAYLALHYWEYFDFADTSLVAKPEITEQAFVDFLGILPCTERSQEALDTLFRRAAVRKRMLWHFIELSEKYLYEPGSPMYDEELYIRVLHSLLGSPALDPVEKLRPRSQLETALKNRPGDPAADFDYLCRDGARGRLSQIEAEYVILYFNDPDCGDCRRTKVRLASSEVLNAWMDAGRLRLLSMCVEGRTPSWEAALFPVRWLDACDEERLLVRRQIYDLRTMPVLYLLDREKRVILKNVSAERLERWFAEREPATGGG